MKVSSCECIDGNGLEWARLADGLVVVVDLSVLPKPPVPLDVGWMEVVVTMVGVARRLKTIWAILSPGLIWNGELELLWTRM